MSQTGEPPGDIAVITKPCRNRDGPIERPQSQNQPARNAHGKAKPARQPVIFVIVSRSGGSGALVYLDLA